MTIEERLARLEAEVRTLKILYSELWRIDLIVISTFHDALPEHHVAIATQLREARERFAPMLPSIRRRIDEVLAIMESKTPGERH